LNDSTHLQFRAFAQLGILDDHLLEPLVGDVFGVYGRRLYLAEASEDAQDLLLRQEGGVRVVLQLLLLREGRLLVSHGGSILPGGN